MTAVAQEHPVLRAIYERRAVRSFSPEIVSESAIQALLDAAVHAPTAMHREPWGFVVIQDPAQLKRYSDRGKAMVPREHLEAHFADPTFNIFYNAGTLIVICGPSEGAFVEADCWLAAENLMLAATALGLGTCCIGLALPILNTPEVKRDLEIPDQFSAIAAIIVGVPSGHTPPVPRKAPVVLHWAR
ncbi:MAG TPA: nitroreductase family protein [Gemmatimonadales bacterium]|nr:nitroreductase family protein [Gemmatimonadales bacterium]